MKKCLDCDDLVETLLSCRCAPCKHARLLILHRENAKRYRGRHPDRVKAMTSRNRVKSLHVNRHRQLDSYGITEEQFQELSDKQDGRCAICGRRPNGRLKNLSVDHCHETGKIRGLLCSPCNLAIGKLGDNAEGVRHALVYLLRTE